MVALHHHGIGIGEAFNLFLPLVLQRGGTDDQRRRDEALFPHQLCRADGLYGLSQAHLIGDNRLPGTEGEADSLFLIRIERCLQQLVKRGIRSYFGQQLPTSAIVTLFQDEVERIVVPAEGVVQPHGFAEEVGHAIQRFGAQRPVGREVGFGELAELSLVLGADAQAHPPLPFVREIDGGIGRDGAARQTVFFLQPKLYAFEVLARTQLIGLEVHARAVVPFVSLSPIHHLVFAARLRVQHLVVAGKLLLVHFGDSEPLFGGCLAAESDLPLFQREIIRLVVVRYFGCRFLRVILLA